VEETAMLNFLVSRSLAPFVCALLLTLAAMRPAATVAEQLVLTPAKDNTIYSSALNGSNAVGNIFVGLNDAGSVRRGLLAFDLSALPPGSIIDAVSLQMGVDNSRPGIFAITAHRLATDWGEGTSTGSGGGGGQPGLASTGDATWRYTFFSNSTWSTNGGDFAAAVSASANAGANGTVTWSGPGLVADVQAWVDSPASNFGWILVGAEGTAQSVKGFYSREDGANAPRLTIDYTPAGPVTGATAETPEEGSIQSGVGLIRGWACGADEVSVSIDGGTAFPIGYGTARADTASVCGDANNGYGMVIAWGLLGNGVHRMQTFVNGSEIGNAQFQVVAIGSGFETGLSGEYVLADFPGFGERVRITWSEADQNFIVTGVDTGAGFADVGNNFTSTSETGTFPEAETTVGGAHHESPGQHSIQSGVGLIRGWACDADAVAISIDGGIRIPIAYGTSRADTQGICGDANNGYGMVIAWGLLGNGVHHLHTFINDVEIADVEFEVVAIGSGFEVGLEGEYRLDNFPATGRSVQVRWSEADQNFRIFQVND
jgi:hypothetical protein